MAISLKKGATVSLTEASPGLRAISIGLGWDERSAAATDEYDGLAKEMMAFESMETETDASSPSNTGSGAGSDSGSPFDLDASVFLLTSEEKVRKDADFIFYNNLQSPCGSVRHTGDNQTGEGEGDDESIEIDLDKLSPEIEKIRVVVTIHDADQQSQHFGMVESAFMRVVNRENNSEVARFDLSSGATQETSLIFGEIYRDGSAWRFHAIGEGYSRGLGGLATDAGVNIA